jgi:hypothetical protein
MAMTIFRLGLVFCAIVGSAFGAAPTVTLRAGAARADITPETEVLNWVTGKPYGKVLDLLSVHALVLDDGATKAVLLRWDLVDVSESARDEVRQAVGTALGMPGENIMVNASHNHSAPWAPVYREGYRGKERDTWWAIRYMPAQNQFPPYKRWMSRLIAGCVEAARRAQEGARPVSMEIGRIAADDFLHNRRPRVPAWGLGRASRRGAWWIPSRPREFNTITPIGIRKCSRAGRASDPWIVRWRSSRSAMLATKPSRRSSTWRVTPCRSTRRTRRFPPTGPGRRRRR